MHCINVAGTSQAAPRIAKESDEVLVARVLRKDEHAFSQLYRRYARYMAGVAFRLYGEDSEIDDTVQEAFVEAVRCLDKLQDPTRLRSWLVTITVRCVRRRIGKRQRRRRLADGVSQVAPRASDPEDRADVDELYQALDQIPEKMRTPWILHKVEGETLPEVAKLCESSLSTIKRRIADADKRLQRRLHA
jgi:RNA polymerase sigma-70 factor (ECF subfamily)